MNFLLKTNNNGNIINNHKFNNINNINNINNYKINKYINIYEIESPNKYDFKKIITINNNKNQLYSKYYNKIKNELLFLFNRKTKVYLHLEQLFYKTNLYHIGISFHNSYNNVKFDIGLFDTGDLGILNKNREEKTIFWDYSNKSLPEIIEYESSLNYKYILGVYDCRHYVRNLSNWTTGNPTPIWRLYKLY
jgi:hypothetical protein